MRNGGLQPAHLPSPPYFGDAADIVAYPKASVSNEITALAMAIACCRDADACNKALADEANERRRHDAARDLPGRASQDDVNDKYDEYDDDYDEYNDDYNEYDNYYDE